MERGEDLHGVVNVALATLAVKVADPDCDLGLIVLHPAVSDAQEEAALVGGGSRIVRRHDDGENELREALPGCELRMEPAPAAVLDYIVDHRHEEGCRRRVVCAGAHGATGPFDILQLPALACSLLPA